MPIPLRVCVVGLGRVARSHLAAIRELPGELQLAAVVSSDPEKREEAAAVHSAPKTFATLAEALEDPDIEAVDLCLPNHLHAQATVESAQAGKHVLVEKPMANTWRDCRRMIRAADEAGITLMVGQSRRYHDAVFKSKELLDQGRIGSLIGITALLFAYLEAPPTAWWSDRTKTGGLMIPLWGNHILDYVLWMFGQKPQRVFCEAFRNNVNWEGEDEVSLLVGFSEGRSATIRMSWNTKLHESEAWDGKGKMLSSADVLYQRYVQGSSGTLHLDDETRLSLNGVAVTDRPQVPSNFALQYQEFGRAIREKREPLTSGRWAAEIIRVQEAALRSAARHEVVRL